MKLSAGRIVVMVNVAIVVLFYAWAGAVYTRDAGDAAFATTMILIMGNFVLAIVLGLARAFAGPNPGLRSAMWGAWLSVGLVILISFPLCVSIANFRMDFR
jgi:hypothetical protein